MDKILRRKHLLMLMLVQETRAFNQHRFFVIDEKTRTRVEIRVQIRICDHSCAGNIWVVHRVVKLAGVAVQDFRLGDWKFLH